MADTGIFATTAEVQRKVGASANTTANTEAYINQFMTEAESYINVVTGTNWTDEYSALNVDVKGILKMAASNLAAIWVLNYDYDSFGNTRHVEDRINTLWRTFMLAVKALTIKGRTAWMIAGATN
jgi:hypothetical protein